MKSALRLAALCGVLVLGAGCSRPASVNSDKPSDTASSTPVVVEPKKWDRTSTPTGIAFDPPAGHWVYALESMRTHYVIPGAAPAVGSEDPGPTSVPRSIALFNDLQNDPKSFPSWEKFEITMAQYGCANGTTEDDFVTCTNKPTVISSGKTVGGFPYREFSLPVVLQKDKSPRGTKTFIVVRFGDKSDNGIMIVPIMDDASGKVPALELAKSMRIDDGATILQTTPAATTTR